MIKNIGYTLIKNLTKSQQLAVYSYDYYFVDVDECLTDNGGCTQTCNNIDGSYQCSCQDGYQLYSDNHTCIGMYCLKE